MEASGLPSTTLAILLKNQADLQFLQLLTSTLDGGRQGRDPTLAVTCSLTPKPPRSERFQEAERAILRTVLVDLAESLLDLLAETAAPRPAAKGNLFSSRHERSSPSVIRAEEHPPTSPDRRVRVELEVSSPGAVLSKSAPLVRCAQVHVDLPTSEVVPPFNIDLIELVTESGPESADASSIHRSLSHESPLLEDATDLLDAIRSIVTTIRSEKGTSEKLKSDEKSAWIMKTLLILVRGAQGSQESISSQDLGQSGGEARSLLEVYLRAVIQAVSKGNRLAGRADPTKPLPPPSGSVFQSPVVGEATTASDATLTLLSTGLASRITRSVSDPALQHRATPHQLDPSLAARLAGLLSDRRRPALSPPSTRRSALNRYRTRDVSEFTSAAPNGAPLPRRSTGR